MRPLLFIIYLLISQLALAQDTSIFDRQPVPKASILGCKIEQFHKMSGFSMKEAVDYARAEINESKGINLRIDIPEERLSNAKGNISVSKVPVVMFLYVAAESCGLDFYFKEGVWILGEREEYDNAFSSAIMRISISHVSDNDLESMGLKHSEGNILLENGNRWLKHKDSECRRLDNGSVYLFASVHDIEIFKSVLFLNKSGYSVKIVDANK